jgi:hypothetical protein
LHALCAAAFAARPANEVPDLAITKEEAFASLLAHLFLQLLCAAHCGLEVMELLATSCHLSVSLAAYVLYLCSPLATESGELAVLGCRIC